jgi:hypothetical protein
MQAANTQKNNFDWAWFSLKASWVFIWVGIITVMILNCSSCPMPTGICKIYTFSPLFTPAGKGVLYALIFVLCLSYMAEKFMLLNLGALALLSCIIISYHESNAIFFRATVLSTVWIAQFIAYVIQAIKPRFNISHWRIQFSVQMIAAVYTLAGIAKLQASGLDWIYAGDGFLIHVMKNFSFQYFDSGNSSILERGQCIVQFFQQNYYLLQGLLAIALFLELFCLAAALNKKLKIIWGLGLLGMHVGIAWVMGIGISVICFPMVIYFINPVYLILQGIVYLGTRQILNKKDSSLV